MLSLLKNIADYLKRSLWFIPLLMSLGGLALAICLNEAEIRLWQDKTWFPGSYWRVNIVKPSIKMSLSKDHFQ